MEEGAAGRPNAYSLSLVMVGLSRDGQHRAAAHVVLHDSEPPIMLFSDATSTNH